MHFLQACFTIIWTSDICFWSRITHAYVQRAFCDRLNVSFAPRKNERLGGSCHSPRAVSRNWDWRGFFLRIQINCMCSFFTQIQKHYEAVLQKGGWCHRVLWCYHGNIVFKHQELDDKCGGIKRFSLYWQLFDIFVSRCPLPGHTVLTHEELETGLKVHHELRTGHVIPWVPEAFLARSNTRELWCLTFSFEGLRPIMSAFNRRLLRERTREKSLVPTVPMSVVW